MKQFPIFLIFVCKLALAQNNYKDGYIILKNQSDTISGFIEDKNWDFNPQEINFKSGIVSDKTYSIKELNAFGIKNKEHYRIKKIDLDVTPFELNNLKKSPELDIQKDQILALRVLLKADLSLLFLKERNYKEHFFYEADGECKELVNHKYLKNRDGNLQVYENKMYIAQLDLLFFDCAKLKKK